ncbi:Ninjurin-1 [Orchesella cincta]|uniref:Ninjurin-1 n=1 Tax=Orchesella cincta TaxID=48709 RepID=A0A1D2N0X8_ORCCI|nr:Ninjurin-1 [Orchesella cincta]
MSRKDMNPQHDLVSKLSASQHPYRKTRREHSGNTAREPKKEPKENIEDVENIEQSPRNERPSRSRSKRSSERNIEAAAPPLESYESLRFTADVVPEPEYFHERFQQENATPTIRLETPSRSPSGRSRSLGHSSRREKLAAKFPSPQRQSPFRQQASINNDSEMNLEFQERDEKVNTRHDSITPIIETRQSNKQWNQKSDDNLRSISISSETIANRESYSEDNVSGDYTSKESYESSSRMSPMTASNRESSELSYKTGSYRQVSPISCRLRSERFENEESEMNLVISQKKSGNDERRLYVPEESSQMLVPDPRDYEQGSSGKSVDVYMNQTNNNLKSGINRHSYESLPFIAATSSNCLRKDRHDVLPLPIEIPDSVSDVEAFRRYLSVRRGAITPDRQNTPFEKRNKSCPSYESVGRRPRRPSVGLSSPQLNQDANRRTASLSHAIMTLALLSASICQLRFLTVYSPAHSYPFLNYFLIFTSIILEVAAGIGYVIVARCSFDDAQSEAIHNYLIFALFIVAISNVVLAAFAFDDHICGDGKRTSGRIPANIQSQEQQINQRDSSAAINAVNAAAANVVELNYIPSE